MFTGIVRAVGTVLDTEPLDDGRRLLIEYESDNFDDRSLSLGASVSVSGVCLTVSEFHSAGFWTDVSGETLQKTTLDSYSEGDLVNLEPSLRVGDELGGHFVFGHVDTTAEINELKEKGDFYRLRLEIPGDVKPYVAKKGSIALDGISLTINRVDEGQISIRIIPHTYQNTRIRALEPGMNMNLEVDMLARYVYTSLTGSDRDQAPSLDYLSNLLESNPDNRD